jgi:hypothetical protein
MAVLSSDQNKNKNFLIEPIIHKWFNKFSFFSIWAFFAAVVYEQSVSSYLGFALAMAAGLELEKPCMHAMIGDDIGIFMTGKCLNFFPAL